MIQVVQDGKKRSQVLARALRFAGTGEEMLSPDWLSLPGIFCIAQENDAHGEHRESASLSAAFACYPKDIWCAVEVVDRDNLYDPVLVSDPARHLLPQNTNDSLAYYYTARGFMVFSLEHDAVILYSPESEFKLVAGDSDFVSAYFKNTSANPIDELRALRSEEAAAWRLHGSEEHAVASEHALAAALSQVKLPPSVDEL